MSKVSTLLYFHVLSTSRKESYCHIKPKKAKKFIGAFSSE